MAEATDDSYIAALTFPALQRFTLAMERFQFLYGWLTSWEKTTLHILNSPDTRRDTAKDSPTSVNHQHTGS
jgi:hypothetical protein